MDSAKLRLQIVEALLNSDRFPLNSPTSELLTEANALWRFVTNGDIAQAAEGGDAATKQSEGKSLV